MRDSLELLRQELVSFAAERDWEQFHTPKNLVMALGGEVGELTAELQWLTDDQICAGLADGHLRSRVADEMADVLIYLVRLADVCGVDLLSAATAKIQDNGSRYPVEKSWGNARKYNRSAEED
ncbi:nucleotide pyrophosphohydrolase [Kribbella speibonae]|uniref:Nucleotide pyrophosphohydrolase n=1 Tax=Kribbella speibonae TaxID=1572660 RepID=A0ABY1ZXD0_9ACTN|nr:nucleotide pyrophosphohydrolase [Kribbella speibonae]TCC19448.1 nucleotide pyrophosphohydrolase [Kribbella speibonae]